ncbi:MAG: bifunctional (p)ppGpp synthetase/guanosine-3',5'-bis(diphosphate) 3'-pyrophosphohydrolase [Pseudomonadota bacterium]
MMRQYELVERVLSYRPDADEGLLNKAYVYAMQKHGDQKRANGDPYFSHPLEVAGILTDLRLDESTVAVALLHDTIEDTDATRAEIDERFGEEIGQLVEGLTKLKRLDRVSKKTEQGENLRRLLLAVSQDIRVLLVKLADRLHNMRTLHFVPEHKRARIGQETMDIYAPLAGRMGMQDIRSELEELSFKYVNPDAFAAVSQKLEDLAEKNRGLIAEIEAILEKKLRANGMYADVLSRRKKPYSVFQKMKQRDLSFEQLPDIYGFRVVVKNIEDCYRALGIVHTSWKTVPGRFKDYISTPKQNDYRSIHTTVVGPSRQRVELQIRTKDMHEIAEFGIAAHALYKDGIFSPYSDAVLKGAEQIAENGAGSGSVSNGVDRSEGGGDHAYGRLRRMVDALAKGDHPDDFLEHTKLELFLDQVFCFTPRGRLIALPRGATSIDFAYAVHTDIGDSCVGCKINGRNMPVATELKNGDEVEIIRGKQTAPPVAWEHLAVTGKARSAIRRAAKAALIRQYSGLGENMVQRAFARTEKTYSEDLLEPALHRLAHNSVSEVLAAVGRGELSSRDVLKAVYPELDDQKPANAPKPAAGEGWFGLKNAAGMIFKVPGLRTNRNRKKTQNGADALPIRGLSGDLPVRFAPDGGAVPGDRIVGILTPNRGITVYPIQSPQLQKFDDNPDRWIDVRWEIDPDKRERFPARLIVTATNEPGTLAQIATVIGANEGNIHALSMLSAAEDFTEMQIDLEVFDLKHLNRIMTLVKGAECVNQVERVNG